MSKLFEEMGTTSNPIHMILIEANETKSIPFREDNGRAQHEFIRQLAFQNNYFLAFAGITKDAMITASKASFNLDYSKMEELVLSCLRPL